MAPQFTSRKRIHQLLFRVLTSLEHGNRRPGCCCHGIFLFYNPPFLYSQSIPDESRALSHRGFCGWFVIKNALIVGPKQAIESFIVGTKNGVLEPGSEFRRHGRTCVMGNHGCFGLMQLDASSCGGGSVGWIRNAQPLKQVRHNFSSLGGRLQVSTEDKFDAGMVLPRPYSCAILGRPQAKLEQLFLPPNSDAQSNPFEKGFSYPSLHQVRSKGHL